MAVDNGKRFEKKFRESLEQVGCVSVERIPDNTYWNGRRMVSSETPCDFNVFVRGKSLKCVKVECKATGDKNIRFDRLETHQSDALKAHEDFHADCLSFVAVNFYDRVSIARQDLCYLVPIAVWHYLEATLGRKSLPIEECESNPYILKCPKKGRLYDMENWIYHVKVG